MDVHDPVLPRVRDPEQAQEAAEADELRARRLDAGPDPRGVVVDGRALGPGDAFHGDALRLDAGDPLAVTIGHGQHDPCVELARFDLLEQVQDGPASAGEGHGDIKHEGAVPK